MGAPEQIEPADPLTESFDNVFGPAFLLVIELSDEPGLFPVGVSPDKTVDNWRLSGLCVGKGGSDSIDLDVFGIVNVDELFIDERAGRPGVNEIGVKFRRFVPNLTASKSRLAVRPRRVCAQRSTANLSEETSSSTASEVDVDIVVLPIDGFLYERLLDDMTIDDDGIAIFPQDDLLAPRNLAVLLVPVAVPRAALDPSFRDMRWTPGVLPFTQRTGEY